MALPGFLWLGWVSLGACGKHVHVHPSLQDAARHKPKARHNIHIRMGYRKPAGDLRPVLGRKELLKEIKLPLGGVLDSAQSPGGCFSAQTRPTQRRFREDICRDRNGRIMDGSTQTRSDNT